MKRFSTTRRGAKLDGSQLSLTSVTLAVAAVLGGTDGSHAVVKVPLVILKKVHSGFSHGTMTIIDCFLLLKQVMLVAGFHFCINFLFK
jgi:hypothetical protein